MKPCLSSPLVLTGPTFYEAVLVKPFGVDRSNLLSELPHDRFVSWLCGPIQLLRDGGPILRDELEAQGAKQASVLNGQQLALRPIT